MLIVGQNVMKDSVEWKVSAESLVPSGVYASPWKARNSKKMYWTLKGKKNLQTIGFGNGHITKFTRSYCVSHLSSNSTEIDSLWRILGWKHMLGP